VIPFVRTKYGLLPQDHADAIAENEREMARQKKASREELLTKIAVMKGLDPKDLIAVDPVVAVKELLATFRARLGKAELERRYPCRTCRVVTDDGYAAGCRVLRQTPCFVSRRMHGCSSWQPRLVATPGA
jgi:hypothetical protein